jgi:hypothetical protein
MYMIVPEFSPILGDLKLRKCAKCQPYNLLLTKVMAKQQGDKRNPGRSIVV